MTATRVVCVGDLMTDVVARASGPLAEGSDTRAVVQVCGGGAAANTAAWLAAIGHHPVAYVGHVGDDVLGRAAVDDLRAAGVDARVTTDPHLPTGACVVVVRPGGERTMLPDAGANAALSPADLPADLLSSPGHLHLSGYGLLTAGSRAAALEALARARTSGMSVSVDPASVAPIRAVGVDAVLGWVAGADLLLPNEAEACLLAGVDDPLRAGALLAERFAEVVVKLGAGGAAWFGGGGRETARTPAMPVDVVDTTGAGDCFAAGFLRPWLAGSVPAEALAAGCALAARVVVRSGARPPG